MNSKVFVIKELEMMINHFSEIKVSYEFDEKALVHVVEILPQEVYHQDRSYLIWENDLFERFIAAYPSENICFVTEDAIPGIDKPNYEKEGVDYKRGHFSIDGMEIHSVGTPLSASTSTMI